MSVFMDIFCPFYVVVASENLGLCIWYGTNQINENWICIQRYPKSFILLTEFGQIKHKLGSGSCSRLWNSNVCVIYHAKVHMASYNFFKNSNLAYLRTNEPPNDYRSGQFQGQCCTLRSSCYHHFSYLSDTL